MTKHHPVSQSRALSVMSSPSLNSSRDSGSTTSLHYERLFPIVPSVQQQPGTATQMCSAHPQVSLCLFGPAQEGEDSPEKPEGGRRTITSCVKGVQNPTACGPIKLSLHVAEGKGGWTLTQAGGTSFHPRLCLDPAAPAKTSVTVRFEGSKKHHRGTTAQHQSQEARKGHLLSFGLGVARG